MHGLHFSQVEIAPYAGFIDAWTVEAIDLEGAIEIAIFDGPRAKSRAEAYIAIYGQPMTSKSTSLTHV